MVTTLAGSGTMGYQDSNSTQSQFNEPTDLALSPSTQKLYVADSKNHRIRMIDLSKSMSDPLFVTTIAGGSTVGGTCGGIASGTCNDGAASQAQFNEPNGLALDDAGQMVFVADMRNHRIRKINIATTQVTTFAGGSTAGGTCTGTPSQCVDGTVTEARFWNPAGLAFSTSGNIYVADKSNQRIRQITPSAVVTTFAGGSTAGGTTCAGISNTANCKNGDGTAAQFNNPDDVDVVGTAVLVADQTNQRIRKVIIGSPFTVTTIAGSGTAGHQDGAASTALFRMPTGVQEYQQQLLHT